ncbi:PREDICTED: apoptosis-inducing factor 2-like isoform X2 [Nelumbo nucifera]|nr:PREDICTED: apoptosis-inducing factor 2-like isoform X2 [Nelumbo nucifera]
MVEPLMAERSVINHKDYLTNGHIITSRAIKITETEVLTEEGRLIAYDYLVVATGHDDSVPKTRMERLRQYYAENNKIKAAKSILIIGGGPTGVELAGEVATDFPNKKVTLVHSGSRLLQFIGPKASSKTLEWLASKKVEVILDESINLNSVSDGNKVYRLSSGKTVTADCHFLCTGKPTGSSWLKETILKDSLDANGRLMVDENLRVKGWRNIFAIGDITDISEIKQGYLGQKHALVAAKNLKLLMSEGKERKMATYKPGSITAIVSLGRKEAVAQFPLTTVIGRAPGMIKSSDLFVGKTRKKMDLRPDLERN